MTNPEPSGPFGESPSFAGHNVALARGCWFRSRMHIAIIGGGPAGLRAAEIAAAGGAAVTLFDAKPSVGRKFLVAGRGGLNLTHAEPPEIFAARYTGPGQPAGFWEALLAEFGPEDLRSWAAEAGIETFVASTGRVYPREMKAAPLLRRWRLRLGELGVRFAMHHRWVGLWPGHPWRLDFKTANADGGGGVSVAADAVILAMGGGSWPDTGSDGRWRETIEALGVRVAPLTAANCGWELDWPPAVLEIAEGRPLKNVAASAGEGVAVGELLITRYGLEGGIIYQLGPALRAMAEPRIAIDFKPGSSMDRLVARMGAPGRNLFEEACRRWRLDPAMAAILEQHPERGAWNSVETLAAAVKACSLRLRGPRPLAEAISSAGGVEWSEIDSTLMLRKLPGVFVAGEMIDWDAPTGGYLMQGCFSTATRAGRSALNWVRGGRGK
jgi:uncharacterized flavoprotein (TIGR03862 family)